MEDVAGGWRIMGKKGQIMGKKGRKSRRKPSEIQYFSFRNP